MGTAQKTYGRKVGHRLSARKKDLMTHALPLLDLSIKPWPKELWMEIGFGAGDHLLQWLDLNPQKGAIGVEVFQNGIASFLSHLRPQDYARCRIFPHPVGHIWPLIPHQILEGIFLLFPDPWPKKAHHKRRLVQKDFLDHCHRCLGPRGQFYLASDDVSLVQWTLEHLSHHPGFSWKAGTTSSDPKTWPEWPIGWPISRYHRKALLRGVPCAYMIWEKVEVL